MQNFVNFIKENYQYFVFAFEFVLAFIGAIIAFLQAHRNSDLESEKRLLSSKYSNLDHRRRALQLIPTLIYKANMLYPNHGDGEYRFWYVYQHVLDELGCKDQPDLYAWVYTYINAILSCDKVEKFSRDTQDNEPKKEFYEKKKDVSPERFAFVRKNGEEKQSD